MSENEKAYERFKLQWMLDHGHTLKELIQELETMREESDPDTSLESLFADWEIYAQYRRLPPKKASGILRRTYRRNYFL